MYRLLRHPLALLALVALCGATLPRGARATDAQPLPRADLFAQALAAYRGTASARLVRNPLLTVVDYALPSSQRRLWVIEPETGHVRFHEFVAHGRGSSAERDPDRAVRFGNEPASHRSSLGTFLTGPTYAGKHGHSLALRGLEPGVNDRAFERRIVIHPAAYVGSAFRAASGGRVGRSFGCPALDPSVSRVVIDTIQGGSVLYAGSGALLAHTR